MATSKLFFKELNVIIAEKKAMYETYLNKLLYPGQPEMQIVLAAAYREFILREAGDNAVDQVLVDTATGSSLDYLAARVGVVRLDAAPAEVKLTLNFNPGHGGVTLPAGTRIGTTDGKILFAIDQAVSVAPSVLIVPNVNATATTDGVTGNGYALGTVSVIVDPYPFFVSATNTTVTAAGAEVETDENLRVRIKLAPNQSSTAGSVAAYKFHTRSANPSIIDVAVTTPEGGAVNVYPLVEGGIVTPQAIIDAVTAILSADTTRPLTDTVTVLSPTRITYTLTVNIILKYGVVQSTTVDKVTAAISNYCLAKANQLGQDVTVSQLIAAAMNPDVHSLNFGSFTDLIVNPISFPVCTQITVGTVTYENPNA